MKISILICVVLLLSIGTAQAGAISVINCDANHGGHATVSLMNAGGKWVGFSARTSSGKVIDVSPIKMSSIGVMGTGRWMPKFGGGQGVVEVRASTWKGYKKGYMVDRLNDTGWVSCR